jgi:hypothetical protein
MISAWALFLVFTTPAFAGADPDLHRKVPEGSQVYDGETAEVGAIYEAFLIHFEDSAIVYLSPSRYRVAYAPNALACRNADQFPIDPARFGRWWRVVFEVLAVRETAEEDPPGSGKWAWKKQFDCLYKELQPID